MVLFKVQTKTGPRQECQAGSLEKVDQPTDWVSKLVIVEKKSLRLYLDPQI